MNFSTFFTAHHSYLEKLEEFFLAPLKGSCFLVFFIYFSGFAIDRSKKYIKVIKNHMKIDAVDP